MTEQQVTTSEATADGAKVLRDGRFARVLADKVVIIDMGRVLELACLQHAPVIDQIGEEDGMEVIQVSPVLSEVLRVRMDFPVAVNVAMNVLQRGIGYGAIDVEKVVETIRSWESARNAEQQSVPEGASGE